MENSGCRKFQLWSSRSTVLSVIPCSFFLSVSYSLANWLSSPHDCKMAAAAPSITSTFKEKEGERVSTSEFSCLYTFHQEARYYPRSASDDLPLGVIGQRWLPLVPRKVNVCLSNVYTVKQPWERLTVAFWQQPKISTTRWMQIFFPVHLW